MLTAKQYAALDLLMLRYFRSKPFKRWLDSTRYLGKEGIIAHYKTLLAGSVIGVNPEALDYCLKQGVKKIEGMI